MRARPGGGALEVRLGAGQAALAEDAADVVEGHGAPVEQQGQAAPQVVGLEVADAVTSDF